MKRFDSSKPARQAGLILLLLVSLTACAPDSECELGENADGTCRLFQLDVLRVEPFGERFHEDGRGARFVSTRSIGSATSFGTESDSYTPVVKPGMAGVVLFSDVDGNLESAFDVPMGNLAQWGVYYSANEYLRSKVLRDGSLLLKGTTGASNWDELQNEPVDGRSTTYNNQHLTVIERDGSIRFHRLLGFGDIEYRDVLELDSAILIVGSVEQESTFRSAFLGDRNVPEFSFQESTSFFALFDKLTGQMLKVVLFDGFGTRAVRLTHDGGIGINYMGLQNTQAKVWMPSGEELVLNPNSSAEIGGVLFLTAELVPDWHAPFKVVDSGLYEEHRIETRSAIFYSAHGVMSYPDNRFEVIVPPGATFLDLNATVERHVFITDRLGVDYAPEGFLGRQAISLGDGTKVRYAYLSEPLSEAQLAYLGLTAEDFQDVVDKLGEPHTFGLYLRTNSDGQLLAFDFCRGDFLDGFNSYRGWEIGFSRSFGDSVTEPASMSNTLKGSIGCYYAGDLLNETAYRQFDGLDPEVRSSVSVQIRYRFY